MFSILLHMFYADSWEKFFKNPLIEVYKEYNFNLFVNLPLNSYNYNQLGDIKYNFPHAFVIETPNIGKDIGGKLSLLDLFFFQDIDDPYLIMIHDKRSPQLLTGDIWRSSLLKIINPQIIRKILKKLLKEKRTGIIGSKDFLFNEYNSSTNTFRSKNESFLTFLMENYGIFTTDYSFIGGTMYWVRSEILRSFFSRYSALNCRRFLEQGNVLDNIEGSYTHAWERLFCWIITSQGYKIKGI